MRYHKLKNIAYSEMRWLKKIGIKSREDLEETGIRSTYHKLLKAGHRPDPNVVYSLMGALLEMDSREVGELVRQKKIQIHIPEKNN